MSRDEFGAETKSPPFGQDAVPFPPSFAPGHCPGLLEMLGIPPLQQNKQISINSLFTDVFRQPP